MRALVQVKRWTQGWLCGATEHCMKALVQGGVTDRGKAAWFETLRRVWSFDADATATHVAHQATITEEEMSSCGIRREVVEQRREGGEEHIECDVA